MVNRVTIKRSADKKYRIKVLEDEEARGLLEKYYGFCRRFKQYNDLYAFRLFILKNLLDEGQLWSQILKPFRPGSLEHNTPLTKEMSSIYVHALYYNQPLKELVIEEGLDNNLERRVADLFLDEVVPKEGEKKDLITDKKRSLEEIKGYLQERIIGQAHAIDAVVDILYQLENKLFLNPLPTIFLQGPSGVGKSALVKHLNEAVFNGKIPLLQVNGPDYAEEHEVAKLMGSPPGYVNSDEPGKFKRQLDRFPCSFILIDEVERAHHKFHDFLMTAMGDGYAFDNRNDKVDFSKAMLFLTSNLGTEAEKIGFTEKTAAVYEEALSNYFEAPFIGRLSAKIVFHALSLADAEKILDLRLREISQRSAKEWPALELSPALRQRVLDEGFSREYGAREITNALNRLVLVPLAKEVSKDRKAYQGKPLYLDYQQGKFEARPLEK